ncbi:hypothetical protein HK100_005069 [Physocladia obscura]|uniref:Uncharacterized protein n=1 Tax=Physocladia obscura TaxID=109957 RepID=A0AAD5STN5_9FUNG|nr:hypothetical protein HK100_005069 [Physocladia obscura]
MNVELALKDRKAEIAYMDQKNKTLVEQIRSVEAQISHLENGMEKNLKYFLKYFDCENTIAINNCHCHHQRDLSTGSSTDNNESLNQLRVLKKQYKETLAKNSELEMKVRSLSEEVVGLHANKDTLQPFRVRQNSATSFQVGGNHSQQDQQIDIMMALCRELSLVNAKLTLELAETKQMLEINQTEVANMTTRIDELEMNDICLSERSSPPPTRRANYSSSLAQEILSSSFKQSMHQMKTVMMINSDVDESPSEMGESVSVNSPIFSRNQILELSNSNPLYDIEKLNILPPLYPDKFLPHGVSASPLGRVLSVGKTSKRETASTTKVFIQSLISMASSLNSRLSKTDTLSEPAANVSSPGATTTATTTGSDFSTIISPTVTLVQTLLTEIAQLRRSMNDLSLAYFEVMSTKAQEHEAATTAAAVTAIAIASSLDEINAANGSPARRIHKTIHRMLSNPGSLFSPSSQRQPSSHLLQTSTSQQQNQQEQQPLLSSAPDATATNVVNPHTNSTITSVRKLSSPRQRSVSSPRLKYHVVPASVTPATAKAINISRAITPIPPTKDDENESDESLFDFDPPPDHPYWRQINSPDTATAAEATTPAVSRKNAIGSSSRAPNLVVDNEEAGLSEIPPPDHPYWKSQNQLSLRSSKSFFDLFQVNKKA